MSTEQNTVVDKVEQQPQEPVLAGTILKEKREALGLTQKQIADRLRLRVAIIQKIEANDFDGEQVATFTRGYLRSYAKAVGIDEKEILGAIEHHSEAQPSEQPMQSFSQKTNKEKHDSRIMKLTWGIFVVIIGISSVWWLQSQQKDTLSEIADTSDPAFQVEEPASPQLTAEPELAPAEDEVKTIDVSAIIDTPEQTEEAATESVSKTANLNAEEAASEDVAVIEEQPQTANEQPKPADGLTNLTMAFTGDCWIQVKDADGKTITTGIKKQGDNVNVNGKAPFKVILGAPEKVSMTLASEPVDLSGYTSGKVARFTLP
ncbi:cytoskeleton protein RodZ [Vibrio mediterranei]|uniref:cytoskeleton protein RodZ n=1 Tax=Vibrio mediterranei TaxID=689 RepID=UPI0017D781DC|nr:cytoskeleton protein RodZ [Vibrio mediterranei]MCY9854866.1 cytoskeleton protein RodZ [Vibrio mediterranei]NUW73491.1 cytoskeleton protein RodZ [Vibrio mediterranei]